MAQTLYTCNCMCYFLSLIALGCLCITLVLCLIYERNTIEDTSHIPLAINTWPFTNATAAAWDALFVRNLSALDAVEIGCSVCENEQCDFTVGFGGSPDENGETTLDAFIMDGATMNVGAVAALRGVKSAASVARRVLEHTRHSLLAGDLAADFAQHMGFKRESLSTDLSQRIWEDWKQADCQPNYWMNVEPDPRKQCGPYRPISTTLSGAPPVVGHDTISMVAIDRAGNVVAGTSSNGANHKVPGRVGDAPLVGAGGYADNTVGAAVCTGDGDVMMRFLPSFLAVEEMRRGVSPSDAAQTAISRIAKYYKDFMGAIIVVGRNGKYGAACHGIASFPYSVRSPQYPEGVLKRAPCIPMESGPDF